MYLFFKVLQLTTEEMYCHLQVISVTHSFQDNTFILECACKSVFKTNLFKSIYDEHTIL